MNKIILTLLIFLQLGATAALAQGDGWTISAQSKDNYNGVTLANGRIGLVSGAGLFQISDIVLNGVYDKESPEGVSRIVRGPVFTNMNLRIDGETISDGNTSAWHQVLNMKEAYLETSVETSKASIKYYIRALRNLPYMGMVEVVVTPKQDVRLEVTNSTVFPEELKNTSAVYRVFRDGAHEMPVYTSCAQSRTLMQDLATCSTFMFDGQKPQIKSSFIVSSYQSMGFEARLEGGKAFRFALVGAACSSRDFCNPRDEAERMAVFALQSGIDHIINGHKAEWERLWQSDIIIEGDPEAQKDVRLALYNLYSFAGEGTRLSIPPMGLSTVTGYNGHVFWDCEIWMYPPLLLLNQQMARSCVDYRSDRLPKAVQRAALFGFKGCMFPWECDDSGEEATPTWCLTGTFEHHITADVGIAFWNYYRVTRDKEWLRREGYPVLKMIADFWVSRAVKNPDGTYSINNVVGANEYAANINDNTFTNGSAKVVLRDAVAAARAVGEKPDPMWSEVSDNIKFHYMPDGTIKENATYNGEVIKQADANLLAYPLGVVTDPKRVRQDLEYYSQKIDKNGPAMGNAILAILYAQLGDSEKAYEYFSRSYIPHKRPPFGVLSETAGGNNPYFCTGAGGLLQAVLYGFGGLRVTDAGIVQQKSVLPSKWKSLTLKGIGPDKKTYTCRGGTK